MHPSLLLGLLAGTALAGTIRRPGRPRPQAPTAETLCPIVFDGRPDSSLEPLDFDDWNTSPFNPDYVKGAGLPWSSILQFPDISPPARFDDPTYQKPFEVTINDSSIFNNQRGFRRAGLQFQGDTNRDSPGSSGIKTIHFSLKWDAQRPLNLSHEYLNVWHETADYSANQFNFQAGAILGQNSLARDTTLRVYYSRGSEPLRSVTNALTNNNAGEGQYQVGILRKPTGTSDVVNSGYHQRNLNEGLIYGSVFVEDGEGGCVSL
ncbi:uncharacterized protein PODANS_1_8450 [Podospora anserina S mat+]|uniref:Podospora anserina S mat+ genomic DNA chromosome 1, supercontig 1 n=1 Tax=Podospora anserina (strain S / ATCC MYA-4624 / DSM 980 / FGSC 10383) TaxID=515849 RepID=B2A953_PODAN|nr:uncharacterized protein PODANS_1_8450 [Podospora anserina S mat+]CAP60554.1 unnamed protein product [Podospora anserina S mat+]CDP23197.1 Putative protein of unknown function [Podospora anserina S mat+]